MNRHAARAPRQARTWLLVGAALTVLVLAGLVAAAAGAWRAPEGRPAAAGAQPTPGALAPDFSAPDLDGQAVQLNALRGRPVWINFWATWCPPCKTEMPLMEEKYRQHQAQGLVILGVNMQESPAAVRAWVGDRFTWRFLIDTDLKLANLYNVEGLPNHVFVDRAGVVRDIHVGELTGDEMDARLGSILTP